MHVTIAAAFVGALSFFPCIGSALAGECSGEIAELTKRLSATDAGSGPTAGAGQVASGNAGTAQHPPTGRMTDATQGRATSPQDVRQQTQGTPTAAEQAKSGQGVPKGDMAEASALLDRAKGLDRDGKETECLEIVRQAKSRSGS